MKLCFAASFGRNRTLYLPVMHSMRFAIIALLWISAASALDPEKPFAQYVLDRWGVQDGFPQVSALQIVQDQEGFIWAATQSGLARFDGIDFRTITLRDEPALMTDHIEVLALDKRGRIWIGTSRGLTVREGETFRIARRADKSFGAVTSLLAYADGMLIGTETGVYQSGDYSTPLIPGAVHALTLSQGRVLAGTQGAVRWLDPESGKSGVRVELPDPMAEAVDLIHWQDRLWIGTSRGLYVHADELEMDPAFADRPVDLLFVDRHGSLWIAAYTLLQRQRVDGTSEWIDEQALGFKPWIVSAVEDHEGNLWLGSKTHSLIRLWDGWTRRYSQAKGLSDPFVWSIARDGDAIWIGTNSGLSRLKGDGIKTVVSGSQLPNQAVYTLFVEAPGCVWLGTRGGLARWCNGRLDVDFPAFVGLQINAVTRHAGRLWVATDSGLFHISDSRVHRVRIDGDVNSEKVRVLAPWGQELLVGTEAGLFAASTSGTRTVASATPLVEAFITSVRSLGDDRWLVATLGRGVFYGSLDGGLIQLDREQGLPGGAVFHMEAPDDGYIWAGSEVGAYRFEQGDLEPDASGEIRISVQNLASSNRLSGSEPARCCNGAGNAKGLHFAGSFWFPTLDGVLRIDPVKISAQRQMPNVVIDTAEISGRTQDITAEPLVVGAGVRDFSLRFTALTFQDPRNVLFRYRLTGYNDDWIYADRRRTAFYTNIAPARYTFEVSASLDGRSWTDPASLDVTIQPTLAETWWFRALVFAGLALLAVLLVWLRLRQSIRVRQRLQALVAERTDELDQVNRQLRSANQKLESVSETDALTGLGNRRYLLRRLLGTDGGASWSLPALAILLDVDHFKQVNDVHGHGAGDQVLKELGRLLSSEIRDGDLAVRWGGEEFLLLVRFSADGDCGLIAERLRKAVENHAFDVPGASLIGLTASMGIVPYPLPTVSGCGQERAWELALELADRALYAAKEGGRNAWAAIALDGEGMDMSHHDVNSAADELLDRQDVSVRSNKAGVRHAFESMGPHSRSAQR